MVTGGVPDQLHNLLLIKSNTFVSCKYTPMKYIKNFGTFLIVFLIAFVVFYFWARRPLYSESEYSKIIEFSANSAAGIGDTFSIVTYNIGYLSGMTNNLAMERPLELLELNKEKAIGLLKMKNPDIIAFQEIDFNSRRTYDINQLEQIGLNADYQYGAGVVNWDKQYVPFPYWPIRYNFGRMLSGQAILSHSKILSNKKEVLPKPESNPFYYNDFYLDRLAQMVWLETLHDSLLVINVHFEAWDAPTRELQAEIVLDIYMKYEQRYPIILLGDFNCTPPFAASAFNEKTIKILMEYPGISMAIEKAQYVQKPESYFTFNSEEPYEKIDYIFYNNKYLACLSAEVLHEAGEISDHLPVRGVFTFITNQ